MKYRGIIRDFGDIKNMTEQIISKNSNSFEWMLNLIKTVSDISQSAKKIGNNQRLFFVCFYRELFNEEGDSYLDLAGAVNTGYRMYERQR